MKKGIIIMLILVIMGFIEVHLVQAENILNDFNKELEKKLKIYDNIEIIQSKNEIGDQIVNVIIQFENQTYINSYVYKDGIISYYLKNGVNSYNKNSTEFSFEVKIMSSILEAFYNVKGYDEVDFLKWSYSLSDEEVNNLTVDVDGISMKKEKIIEEKDGSKSIETYITELNLDLVNGIKSHTFKPKQEIELDNEDINNLEEKKQHNEEKRTNKFNITFFIYILFFIDLVGMLFIFLLKKAKKGE